MLISRLTIAAVLLAATSHPALAGDWGKVPEEDLAMTQLQEDPSADAVFLFDRGELKITERRTLELSHHRRIKILTDRGLKYADVAIPFWHEDKVKHLKAHTVLPDGRKVKLKGKNVFDEGDPRVKRKVFTFPAAQVGSVLEYSYQLHSKNIQFPKPWYFQNSEFTRESRIKLTAPSRYDYQVFYRNFRTEFPEPVRDEIFGTRTIWRESTWTVLDLPRIKSEPFMLSPKRDYLAAIFFQLASYESIYQRAEFIREWDDIAEVVGKRYARILSGSRLKKFAKELTGGSTDQVSQARAIYDFVRSNIKTLPYRGLYSTKLKMPAATVESRAGSAVEKNLLLLNLLRCAAFDANPLLISTRKHGRLSEDLPQLSQFNHVIAVLTVGARSYHLDTRNVHCPFGLLPPDDLTNKGFLIEGKRGRIVDIPAPRSLNAEHAQSWLELSETGDAKCRSSIRYEGYRALTRRDALASQSEESFVKKITESRFGSVTVDSFSISGEEDIGGPLQLELHYRLPNHARVAGDMIYLTPSLLHRLKKNPFANETRDTPVEFGYRRSYSEEVRLKLPDGYRIIEAPPLARRRSKDIQFTSLCARDEEGLKFQRRLVLNKPVFQPDEYKSLQVAYRMIVGADRKQIILARRTEADVEGNSE